ncbi:MAG: thioredoxin domain-containing protein [Bacteroidota bacterium]
MSLHTKVSSTDQKQGNNNAGITFVEYGDYECPHCGDAYPVVKKLQRHFGDDLLFVFRNFPLGEIHPYAAEVACAAEAAGVQGKFWPMHDLIFENQQTLSSRQLLNFGRVIGADIEKLARDMASDAIRDKIENDMQGGIRSGVNGTPTFFINSKRYDGYHDFESLKEVMDKIVSAH